MQEIEIWVMMDESGDYTVGTDADETAYAYDNDIGGTQIRRIVCLKLKMNPPIVQTVTGIVPDEPEAKLSLKAITEE